MPMRSQTMRRVGTTARPSRLPLPSPPSTSSSAGASPRSSRCSGPRKVPIGSCRPEPALSTARCMTCSPLGIRPCPPTRVRLYPSLPQPEQTPTVSVALYRHQPRLRSRVCRPGRRLAAESSTSARKGASVGATHHLGLLVEYVFNGIQDHRPDLVASRIAQGQHLGCPLMSSLGGFRTECVDQVNGGPVGVCPADHRDVSPRLDDREEVDDVRNGIMVAFPLPHCHILLSVLVSSDSYPGVLSGRPRLSSVSRRNHGFMKTRPRWRCTRHGPSNSPIPPLSNSAPTDWPLC